MTPDPSPRPNARGPRVRRGQFDAPTLRVLRTEAQLSREELADQVGISVSAIKMWETGARVPTESAATRIAEALGVDLTALSGTDGPFDPAAHSLRSIRFKYGLSTAAVLAATGASDDTVQDVEAGRRLPPDPALWAKAYRITQAELMSSWALGYTRAVTPRAEQA